MTYILGGSSPPDQTVFLAAANAAQTLSGGANTFENLKPQNVITSIAGVVSWNGSTGVLTLLEAGVYSILAQFRSASWTAGAYALDLLSGSKVFVSDIKVLGSTDATFQAQLPHFSFAANSTINASVFKSPAPAVSTYYINSNDEFRLMINVVKHT